MKAEDVQGLVEEYAQEVEIKDEKRVRAFVDNDHYRDTVQKVRDFGVFKIITMTATDLGDEFEIIDHYECKDGVVLDLKHKISKGDGKLRTITDIFPGAIFYEREIIDLFGIEVEDHPDPRRLYLADDWPENKHPLREGMYNYHKLAEKNISEIKEIAEDEDFEPEMMIEVEKENKNRKSLLEWLENKVSEEEEE